jgi:hypothetical protein
MSRLVGVESRSSFFVLSFRSGYLLVDVYLGCVSDISGHRFFRELFFLHLRGPRGGCGKGWVSGSGLCLGKLSRCRGDYSLRWRGLGFGVMGSFCFFLLAARLGTGRNLYGIRSGWSRDKGMGWTLPKVKRLELGRIPRYESTSCYRHHATFMSCADGAAV